MNQAMNHQGEIERIVERLRKDHPDPKMRQQLYDKGGLPAYVRVLMPEASDEALGEVTSAVRAAEDGSSAE